MLTKSQMISMLESKKKRLEETPKTNDMHAFYEGMVYALKLILRKT